MHTSCTEKGLPNSRCFRMRMLLFSFKTNATILDDKEGIIITLGTVPIGKHYIDDTKYLDGSFLVDAFTSITTASLSRRSQPLFELLC